MTNKRIAINKPLVVKQNKSLKIYFVDLKSQLFPLSKVIPQFFTRGFSSNKLQLRINVLLKEL